MCSHRAVVFDMDDTLYLERAFVSSGFSAVGLALSDVLNLDPAVVVAQLEVIFEAGTRGTIFDSWLCANDLETKDLLPLMIETYRQHRPQIALLVDADRAIARLRQDFSLGLLSDGLAHTQQNKVDALGIAERLDQIQLTGDLGREYWKPSTLGYEMLLGRLGAQAHRAVYVADNPLKDFVGAKTLGMKTIRVRRSRGLYRHLEAPDEFYAPDVEIATLDDLDVAISLLLA